ncbi:hypothetical protein G6F24_015972 [Rhizopus arrhizus]|nr:hypothetical protein G6F24_015972 [Rhizopus arrhizus]
MATLQVKVRSISRMAVFLIKSSVLASTSRAFAIEAASSFTFNTRNAAECVSGAVICCGSLSSVWLRAVIGAGWEFTTVPAGLRRAHRARRCAGDHSGTPLPATERFSVRHYAEGAAGAKASRGCPRVISNGSRPCHAIRRKGPANRPRSRNQAKTSAGHHSRPSETAMPHSRSAVLPGSAPVCRHPQGTNTGTLQVPAAWHCP